MERIGVLIVSKSLSSAAMVDALSTSERYATELYIAEKQLNPFNLRRAEVHHVIPDLNLDAIAGFARRYKHRLTFGLTDTEDFVTAGGRDRIEAETGVPVVCVTKEFAVERSKADQRLLFERLFKSANPRFRVFGKDHYPDEDAAVSDFRRFASELARPVVKPDAPARGAGVGVWGADFSTEDEMVAFFRNVYSKGRVVVEERVDGEESSFHGFSDGRHFVAAPQTRDYKRALDSDRGRLTGGMGSYRSQNEHLPFLTSSEWEHVLAEEEAAFRRWKGKGSQPGLRGIVLYDALMHTGEGFKLLERNSRGGNTEQINLLTTMKDDYAEVCIRMVEGTLTKIEFRREASVVTCLVPEDYGTGASVTNKPSPVDIRPAEREQTRRPSRARLYPMDLRVDRGRMVPGTSRTLAAVGLGGSLEAARRVSLSLASGVKGRLRYRSDLASPGDVRKSRAHLERLRLSG